MKNVCTALLKFLVFCVSFINVADAFIARSSLRSASLSSSSWKDGVDRENWHPISRCEHSVAAVGGGRIQPRGAPKSRTRCKNFLKDAFENAFSNDRNLSNDKRKGQYDDIYTGEEYVDSEPNNDDENGLTDIQKKWRRSQTPEYSVRTVNYETVVGKSLSMDLYLSGVPERDPSNDLYGSRVNISSRDKVSGLSLPPTPSVTVKIDFLLDGVCRVSKSGFTSEGADGEWKCSEDGAVLRFSIDSLGYTRTVQTKGSIQNVAWTNEEDKVVRASSTYSIPPGMVYGDIRVTPGRIPGTFDFEKEGALRIEMSTGLFGIASEMVACGKFVAMAYKEPQAPA